MSPGKPRPLPVENNDQQSKLYSLQYQCIVKQTRDKNISIRQTTGLYDNQ